jgi:hypothetical protein
LIFQFSPPIDDVPTWPFISGPTAGVESHEDSNRDRHVSDCCSPSDGELVVEPGQKAVNQAPQAEPELQMRPPILDAGARLNPLKIALLHWYLADTSTFFTVGGQPYGLAFDGANIWTANFADGTVSKVRANDGEILGTFEIGTGFEPYGITFDGANVWISNTAAGSVTKLRASDGKTLGSFAVGPAPGWMTFDGQNAWVPVSPSQGPGSIKKLRALDGKTLGSFQVGNNPIAAAFDGGNVWVTNGGANTVTKLRASDGAVMGTFTVGNGPLGIAFDGADMWVANRPDGTVTKLRASDGTVLGTFPAPDGPYGVAFDGAYIWVTGDLYTRVLRASDGVEVAARQLQTTGVAFDGAYAWVAETNRNRVHKF